MFQFPVTNSSCRSWCKLILNLNHYKIADSYDYKSAFCKLGTYGSTFTYLRQISYLWTISAVTPRFMEIPTVSSNIYWEGRRIIIGRHDYRKVLRHTWGNLSICTSVGVVGMKNMEGYRIFCTMSLRHAYIVVWETMTISQRRSITLIGDQANLSSGCMSSIS